MENEFLRLKQTSTTKVKSQPKKAKIPKKWLRLYPHGLVQGLSEVKPILLFCDKKERDLFPLWVDYIEMDSLHHYFTDNEEAFHPYQTPIKILKELGWEIDRICFTKIDGYRVYATLVLIKDGKEKSFTERAEDLILMALNAKAKIYTSRDLINKVKDIKDLKHLQGLDIGLSDYKDSQKYLM